MVIHQARPHGGKGPRIAIRLPAIKARRPVEKALRASPSSWRLTPVCPGRVR